MDYRRTSSVPRGIRKVRALYPSYFLYACLDCRFRFVERYWCKAIAAHVGTRTADQVHSHAQYHERKMQGFSEAVACISLHSLQLTSWASACGLLTEIDSPHKVWRKSNWIADRSQNYKRYSAHSDRSFSLPPNHDSPCNWLL